MAVRQAEAGDGRARPLPDGAGHDERRGLALARLRGVRRGRGHRAAARHRGLAKVAQEVEQGSRGEGEKGAVTRFQALLASDFNIEERGV